MVWLPLALFALVTWSIQRVVTKAALLRWSTARFYRWNAIVSLVAYVPFALFVPPRTEVLAGALGLSALMALTFGVTTEATRRGPVGVVAPLTATSPALTVVLAMTFLGERPDALALAGVACAIAAAILLALRPRDLTVGSWLRPPAPSPPPPGARPFFAQVRVTRGGPPALPFP